MKKFYKHLLLSVILVFNLPVIIVLAHPGSLDGNGGHYDRSTGEYHYHHGYPPHQHPNGECPYDFDDQTNTDSGTGKSLNQTINSTIESATNTRVDTMNSEVKIQTTEQKDNSDTWFQIGSSIILGGGTVYVIFKGIADDKKSRNEKAALTAQKQFERQKQIALNNAKFQKEYNYYFNLYAFYDPIHFVTKPKNAYIRDWLPVTSGRGTYGKYTVYITQTGTKYHTNKNCVNAKMIRKNAIHVIRSYAPCLKCVKEPIPSLDWYIEYARIVSIKRKYNIP